MVFQNYALYPHKTVAANMGFPLKMQGMDKAQIAVKVDRAADILGLKPYLARDPRELSGGQRQRVAMGRAIVRDPQVFLFDEPLSNLDAKLRVQMRSEIRELHQRLSTTTIYVTHDQIEAMTMADRIVVMRDGHIALGAEARRLACLEAGFLQAASYKACRRVRCQRGASAGDTRELLEHARLPEVRVLGGREAIQIKRVGGARQLRQHLHHIAKQQRERDAALIEDETMHARHGYGP
jgi:ABC-type sulfate/molybdate transport systems ATPase subunit